jgi:hypothetical protein
MVPFNFAIDTLFLGRKLKKKHAFFKKHAVLNGKDLEKVQFLMVDAYLNWGKRTKDDRGMGNLGHMSRLIFKGVKKHTVFYPADVVPLPHVSITDLFTSHPQLPFRLHFIPSPVLRLFLSLSYQAISSLLLPKHRQAGSY